MTKKLGVLLVCFILPFYLSAKSFTRQDTLATNSDSAKVVDEAPTVTIEDIESNDEGAADQGVSSVLTAGRDPFLSAATFSFSISRFKIRGYDNDFFETYMNGIPTEYIDNGFSSYNLWSSLNDVVRGRDNSEGMRPTPYSFGTIGGVYSIDSRASKQRKQLSVTVGTSNRTYDFRGGLTWGSGITKKGWSFSASFFGRYAKQGYVKGTYMQSLSYFASIEKIFAKQSLALTAFGVPIKQGKTSPVVQEAIDLTGDVYYNPNWGYQNGKIRSARVEYRHQPVMILTHDYKPNDRSNLITALGYSFGERTLSGFDRYNGLDPRPDYYRYLPSYYSDSSQEDLRNELIAAWQNDPSISQVDWEGIYEANDNEAATTINDVDGVSGNNVTGKRAVYILRDDVQKHQRFNLNSVYNLSTKKKVEVTAGITYQFQKTNYFKRVKDLLGSDYYVDIDEFTESDSLSNPSAAQNDLNHPNRVVYEGDKYGYNYDAVIHKISAWGQAMMKFDHIDFYVAGELLNTMQWREGHYKNGLNPTNSEGQSTKYSYFNYAAKAGLTYKINGRNYIFTNGVYRTRAPYWDNIFISPRNTNSSIDVGSEKIGSVELGYILNSPRVKLRATGYFTSFQDGSNSLIYYDDFYNSLGNYTLTNVDRIHYGGELGVEAYLYKGLSASLVAAVGKYYYTSRQTGTLTIDADPNFYEQETIYSKNFYVANTPQQAYTLGLNYRSKKFWYISMNVNFFDRIFSEIAPTHRTIRATDAVPYQSDQWNAIVDQERLNPKGQWSLDLSGGYSWRLKSTFKKMKSGNMYLVLNTGISNVTNNKKFIVSGREQLRFDYENRNPEKFPSKYAYAYGINFFLNLTFRM